MITKKLFYFFITFAILNHSNLFAKKIIPFEFFQGNLNQNLSKKSKVYLKIFTVKGLEEKSFIFDSGDFTRYRNFPSKSSSINIKDSSMIKINLFIKTDENIFKENYTLIYKEKCNCLSVISIDKLKEMYPIGNFYNRKDTSSYVPKNTYRYINLDKNIGIQLRIIDD